MYSAGVPRPPIQERFVDLLDMNSAVLYDLDAIGDFNDLASCLLGIGIRPVRHEFHTPSLSREWGDQRREKKRANAPICEIRFAPPTDIEIATRQVRKVPQADSCIAI